jgi:hypothetical protein
MSTLAHGRADADALDFGGAEEIVVASWQPSP